MVPPSPPDGDSEAGRCEAIFNFEILGNSVCFCECNVVNIEREYGNSHLAKLEAVLLN